MKKEIDRTLYMTVRDFFDNRVEIYEGFAEAVKDDASKVAKYNGILKDMTDIKENFEKTYKPAKQKRRT